MNETHDGTLHNKCQQLPLIFTQVLLHTFLSSLRDFSLSLPLPPPLYGKYGMTRTHLLLFLLELF
ncbi:hypothetical protein PUN28_003917 [Cardiocondyla obscurior]|uniref:Uncharacterized protein n=1 Tax=Cardiocondyla obscurior TaxID=286306 RepID=A0AAW2GPA6_9HYME